MSDLKAKRSTQANHDVGVAAMDEFDLHPVGLDQPGAPNPGYIAGLLADLHAELEDAIASGDLGGIVNAADRLGRLRSALETWEFCVLYRPAHRTAESHAVEMDNGLQGPPRRASIRRLGPIG